MREIKFRFWNKNAKSFILDGENKVAKFNLILFSYYARSAGLENLDDYVIQQFTEHLDDNGKEIYEGDILSLINPNNEVETISEVVFEWWGWRLKNKKYDDCFANPNRFKIRIIGNIFENADLLK